MRLALTLFAILVPAVAQARCSIDGTFERARRGLLAAQVQLSAPEARTMMLKLVAFGPKMYDGNPTIGAMEGAAKLGESSCAAVLTSAETDCTLTLVAARGGIDVHQFGQCLGFGAGVDATGFYKRKLRQ